MTQYLITFYEPPGIPEAELSEVAKDGAAGFDVVEVPSGGAALEWAAKVAAACRCPQEVREFRPDPTIEEK